MESTKIEVRSKPLLSPTQSLDEGFESDPDRISTDSQLVGQTPEFDVLQHTDRDGMQHTQITRRAEVESNNNTSNLDTRSGPTSIICLEGEIDSEIHADIESNKISIHRISSKDTLFQSNQQQRYRRVKTRAPPPPIGAHTFKPRSQSVESVIRYNTLSVPNSTPKSASHYNHTLNNMDILTGRADVLSGRYVRVTVDPRASSRLTSINNSLTNTLPTKQLYGLTLKSNASYNGSLRNFNRYHSHSSSHLQTVSSPSTTSSSSASHQQQYHMPVCWTQSIPRQTRRLVYVNFCFTFNSFFFILHIFIFSFL